MSTTAATPAAPRTGWPFRLMLAGSLLIAAASLRYLIPGAPGGAPGIMDNAFTRYGVLTVHAGFAVSP